VAKEASRMTTKVTPDKLVDEWFEEEDSFVLPTTTEIPKREYENKLIAWFDVLGMSKKIIDSGKSDSGAEDILINIGKLRNCVENSCEYLLRQSKLEYIQLNDGFIIVCELDCIDELCKILCEIQWKVLIEVKLPVRGALTAGQVIISTDPKIIIGPAFIKAHMMEDEIAIFPRILFSDEIYKYIDNGIIGFSYITKDADNLQYLDYLKYEFELEENYRNFDNKLKVHGIKQLIKERYNDNITNNLNIAQKYGWIINKLSILRINVNY
jgi:hypothetical protein